MPEFDDLPFDVRPDLSPYLIHLTKNTQSEDGFTAFDNLLSILEEGRIWGSRNDGFVKGPNKATCFMDIPHSSLKYILDSENANPDKPRYEPCGVIVTKRHAYNKGCRPVLYLSNNEVKTLGIPTKEKWRVVRLEVQGKNWISWLHEREWRCKGDFRLPPKPLAVFVKNTRQAMELQEIISGSPSRFRAIPQSIIPLTILCQGLAYL